MVKNSAANNVKIRVTKLGAGKVSTGVHVAASGEVMAQAGDMLTVPQAVADMLVVVHGGGDMAEMLDALEPAMCAFARAQGCTLTMGTGRKGWERATRSRGYRFGYLTVVKSLS